MININHYNNKYESFDGQSIINIECFKSEWHLISTLKSRELNSVFRYSNMQSSQKGYSEGNMTSSYQEAESLFLNGWDAPLKKIKKGVL